MCAPPLQTDPSDVCLTKFEVIVIAIRFPPRFIVVTGWNILFDLLSDRHVQRTIVTAGDEAVFQSARHNESTFEVCRAVLTFRFSDERVEGTPLRLDHRFRSCWEGRGRHD
jgi:hypothetical protein